MVSPARSCLCSRALRWTPFLPVAVGSSGLAHQEATRTDDLLDKILPPGLKRSEGTAKAKSVPEGLWIKCPSCDAVLYPTDLENNLSVCPKCEHHMRLPARARLDRLLDPDGRVEIGQEVRPLDPLKFKDSRKYPDRLVQAATESSETEAMVVMSGSIHALSVVVACFEFEFMGGSMGSVVGERFVRGVQAAIEQRAPFISIASSGGARMQEGLLSLMQMAKTTAALTGCLPNGSRTFPC